MGAQQILDTIRLDAQADAQRMLNAAQAEAEKAKADALAAAGSEAAGIEAKAAAEAAETEKRRLLTAGIEARKSALAKKRALIDEVFAQAKQALCSLSGEEYRALVCGLVTQGAQTGCEQVVVPADVAERYTRPFLGGKTMLELLNEALVQAGKTGSLTLSDRTGNFAGGVQLIGEESDVDCSFGALVDAFRDENEAKVYALLFQTEE